MFVTTLEIGAFGTGKVSNPNWQMVEVALRKLDGDENDSVILGCDDESYMGVVGGNDGRYFVGGFLKSQGSFACSDGNSETLLDVACAGDFNQYPAKNVLWLDAAITAAKAFYELGQLCSRYKWEMNK